MLTKQPNAIIHRNKPENYEQMASDAASNLKLTKRATKLLMYYAGCKNGFKPSLSAIDNNTGVGVKNITIIRKELVNHGVVGFGEQYGHATVIDWNRIRDFARLEKPLEYEKKNSEKYFSAVQAKGATAKRKRFDSKSLLIRGRQYRIPGVDEKNDLFLQFFGNMNEQEYTDLITSFPEYDRNKQTRLISDYEYAKYFNSKVSPLYVGHDITLTKAEMEQYEKNIDFMKNAPHKLPF